MKEKTILIAGSRYTIKKNPKNYGGSFDAGKQVIEVGTKGKPDYQFQVLVHEVIEAILTERNHRYQLSDYKDNEHYLFSFNHDQFDNVCKDIALAFSGIKSLTDK
jgi:hypothetical protein